MAVVTATIAAVSATMAAVSTIGAAAAGAATVGAAVAATASAVVAVANVVGMVGLAVTAVGAITGNEDLLEAGKIMGYVGIGGNLLGYGVGFAAEGFKAFSARIGDLYASSWDKGMGKMFSSTADDAIGGAGAASTAKPTTGNPNFTQAPGAEPGIGNFPAPGGPQQTNLTGINPAVKPGTGFLNSPQATAPMAPTPGIGDPNAALQSSVQSATSVATPKPMDFGIAQGMTAAAPEVGGAAAGQTGMQGFLNNPMLPLAAGQIISGGAGGLFTGAAKEEEVEMLRRQNELNEQQRQYLNRNNQFAPSTI